MVRLVTVCLLLLLGGAQSSQRGVSAPPGPPNTQDPPHLLGNQQAGHQTTETSCELLLQKYKLPELLLQKYKLHELLLRFRFKFIVPVGKLVGN